MPSQRRIRLYLRASGESGGWAVSGEAIQLIIASQASGREVRKERTRGVYYAPCTNASPAASISLTSSGDAASAYTRNKGSVPDARNNIQASAPFPLVGASRKNLIPSSASFLITPYLPSAWCDSDFARASMALRLYIVGDVQIAPAVIMRPVFLLQVLPRVLPAACFSSANTFAKRREFRIPSRSGR